MSQICPTAHGDVVVILGVFGEGFDVGRPRRRVFAQQQMGFGQSDVVPVVQREVRVGGVLGERGGAAQ